MSLSAVVAQLPTAPMGEPVSRGGQLLMTVGTFAGLAIVVAAVVRLRRRWGVWTPVALLAGSVVAGMVEPLNNRLANMWYYRPGQVGLYRAFGGQLPVWVFFSYAAFFGGFGLLVWWLTERGATRATIAKVIAGLWVFAVLTEITGTRFNTYEYFGPHPFRVAGFPIWVSLGVSCICVLIGVGTARIRRAFDPGAGLASIFLLGPVACVVGLVGTGFPAMTVINTVDPPSWLVTLAGGASTILNLLLAWFITQLVPPQGLAPIGGPQEQRRARLGERDGQLAERPIQDLR
jgi:hypothetical protein